MNDESRPTVHVGGDVTGQIGIGGSIVQSQAREDKERTRPAITVLFWAANPIDTDRLRLDEEVRTIDERLRTSAHRERFDLRQQWATRYTDLSDGLLRYQPQIVHFSGHGSPTGTLLLEDSGGRGNAVDTVALADLLRIAGDTVRCVVFNACYSSHQAQAVAEHIDCVVGTSQAIGDEAAISFAAGFYRALGYGRSVLDAFELGQNEVELASSDEYETPQLHTKRGIDAATVTFV